MFLEVQNALKATKMQKCAPNKILGVLVIQQYFAFLRPQIIDYPAHTDVPKHILLVNLIFNQMLRV